VKQSLPLKIDLHIHTCYSKDATTTLKEVVQYARKRGLDGVAVTDHGTTKGALKLAKQKQILTIPGIEVNTLHGHVLALNVNKPIKPNRDLTETVEKIRELGGTAVIAHPSVLLKAGIAYRACSASNIDAVEIINSASFPFFLSTYLNYRLAERLKLPKTAGSDAHHPQEIGNAYTIIDADPNPDDALEAIKKGKAAPFGKPMSWASRLERVEFYMRLRLRRRHSSKFSI
jgi:predicted metal-dependent phosphoesterase TrpH